MDDDERERRISALEKQIESLRERSQKLEVEKARLLLVAHLKQHADVEPMDFAIRYDLALDVVEIVLKEFDQKQWTVPVAD